MHRRKLLVGCLLSLAIPGCLGAPSASEDEGETTESGGTTNTSEIQQAYVIHLEPSEGDVDEDESLCEYNELTDTAQDELEQAIESEEYHVEETPELLMRNCHNGYVEYQGEFYWLRITIESG